MQRVPSALDTDYYQITMAAVYYRHGLNAPATFSLFAHDLPPTRGYMVAAGLELCLEYLENFCFKPHEIEYLDSLGLFSRDFLEMLEGLRFTGEVWALPEGTVCFAEEPLLEVTAPLIEAQLVETMIINIINLHTTLATKAARCIQAAAGRACVDFSLRRTHGLDGGLAAARSSAIVGFVGTSNVEAARVLGLRPVGTMAHSLVEAFGDEKEAFRGFASTFPDQTVLLVDTYDTLRGVQRAIEIAGELKAKGHKLVGVRLDSGDLVGMSIKARQMLDKAGLKDVVIVASGSLDEFRMSEILAKGAKIDLFGVGTRMGNSADAPYIDFAYKLVSYDGRPTLKLSTGKQTWAGAKQLWRELDDRGRIARDMLGLRDEQGPGEGLLVKVMEGGKRTSDVGGWRQARERFKSQWETLPPTTLRLSDPHPIKPEPTPALIELQERARKLAVGR